MRDPQLQGRSLKSPQMHIEKIVLHVTKDQRIMRR